VKYRYGETTVLPSIKMACTYLVAAHLLSMSDKTHLLPEGGAGVLVAREKIDMWTRMAHEILDREQEFVMGGG
jgi:hypothetical protein